MSNLIYPSTAIPVAGAGLPGITFDSVRSPQFKTGIQQALTGVESRIQYQQYVLWQWELIYEYLTPANVKAIRGLYLAVAGQWDTFLFLDPWFNSVTAQQFAVVAAGDTTATLYQITATDQNTGGPGAPEAIQNFNSTPMVYGNGTLLNPSTYSINGGGQLNFVSSVPSAGTVLTWTGTFYYRVRFDDDSMDVSQFMLNFFELKKVKLRQVKL